MRHQLTIRETNGATIIANVVRIGALTVTAKGAIPFVTNGDDVERVILIKMIAHVELHCDELNLLSLNKQLLELL